MYHTYTCPREGWGEILCIVISCAVLHLQIRKMIISNIMGTDMSHHFGLVSDLVKQPVQLDSDEEASRVTLSKIILHSVDISNPVRTFEVGLEFGHRIQHEFM